VTTDEHKHCSVQPFDSVWGPQGSLNIMNGRWHPTQTTLTTTLLQHVLL